MRVLIAVMLCASAAALGQIEEFWVARYDGPTGGYDYALDVAFDAAGDVYVTGLSYDSLTNYDYATVKYDGATGAELWVVRYNGPGNSTDASYALALDATGNVIVTGGSIGATTGLDYATVKYDGATGAELWVTRYHGPGGGADIAYAVAVDAAGDVYVTGQSSDPVSGQDYATVKYDGATGAELWVARYDGPGGGTDVAYAIALDPAGNVIVTGGSIGATSGYDYATVKYDGATGAEQWVARYDGPLSGSDLSVAVALDPAGNVYVTGYSQGSGTGLDYATVKYDGATGVQQWVARYNGPASNTDMAYAIALDPAGDVYVTGGSIGATSGYDYATVKYDGATGAEQWVARYDGPGNSTDLAQDVALDAAGNVYVTGQSSDPVSGQDYATVKYDGATGAEQWVARYDGPGNSTDLASAIALDPAGNIVVTGWSFGTGGTYDFGTVKYVQDVTLTSIVPNSGALGATVPVTLTGTNFGEPVSVSISGTGVTAANVTVVSATQIAAEFVVDDSAALGNRDVTVSFGSLTSHPRAFRVRPMWPEGWREVASLPAQVGNRRDAVHRGGWLASGPEGTIYAVKGNKLQNFYRYDIQAGNWVELAPVPFDPVRGRPLRQGSRGISDGDNSVYVVHGNNTLAFWRYRIATNEWTALADVPEGPSRRRVRGGGDLLYIEDDGSGSIYLLKGDRDEFWRYLVIEGIWEQLATPPVGVRNRWQRDSWLAFDGENTVYALKARYFDRGTETHEFWRYDVAGDSWHIADTLAGMPLWGNFGGRYRRKRARDGGAGAYRDGRIYALKGGNTEQFLFYDLAANLWNESDTLPTLGTTGRRRRVNAGGDLVYGPGAFYALKGNRTVEFWRYVVPAGPVAQCPGHSGVMAGEGRTGTFVSVGPNPVKGGLVTLRYSLPKAGPAAVTVYDVAGRAVFSTRSPGHLATGSLPLDLRFLGAGIYLVKVEAGGYAASQKLVVQK